VPLRSFWHKALDKTPGLLVVPLVGFFVLDSLTSDARHGRQQCRDAAENARSRLSPAHAPRSPADGLGMS